MGSEPRTPGMKATARPSEPQPQLNGFYLSKFKTFY